MKTLRAHTLKIWVIALVCSGLTMAASQPVQASKSSNAFASWMQSLTKKTSAPELEKKLRSLKHEKGDLNRLIEQASQIVSLNNEDFNLPKGTASGNIRHILLVEWNQFQSGNAMAAIPSAETIKPSLALQHQKTILGDIQALPARVKKATQSFSHSDRILSGFTNPFRIIPLISGIAIGAP